MNDFRAEPERLKRAMRAAFDEVLESGWYILGKRLERFEEKWAQECGVARCVGVANGLDAIEIALRVCGIGPGDEVITTPMTAFATALAVLRVGATPRFADIDPDTALLSVASARALIGPKTRAIIPVYLYGQLREPEAWVELCDQHGLELIEDCAQAHLASVGGRIAGSFGKAGAYSFYPTKNLGALGDAGALVTDDLELADKAARFRNYGQSLRYHHPDLGQNSRLDEVQAAILDVRLGWLHTQTDRRREIAARYSAEISNPAIRLLAPPTERDAHVYHLYVIACETRDALQAHLEQAGIQTHIHYPIIVPDQPPCAAQDSDAVPHARQHAATCLSLPIHPGLDEEAVSRVVAAVNMFGQ
ncbi:DegT/DnrJ/EryC1/StrS family aminotransferase [Sphingomonas psychrotolerans]|uniref:DegT/DnrJ/EryC1/StrS family aminotransferase n=2 Tax=Sphingomonas psychrotolerans TaxID=1327635 RepID=A0A2K8MK75_9SPHN|nr:DegT/DnrJ/EryC1/StrS family aminotransferase [Sphingomonas psychrotolerans]